MPPAATRDCRYFQGKYFFDIHPPLGKLTLALVGWWAGYDASVCAYDAIHQVFSKECKYMVLRITSGACGCAALRLRGWGWG